MTQENPMDQFFKAGQQVLAEADAEAQAQAAAADKGTEGAEGTKTGGAEGAGKVEAEGDKGGVKPDSSTGADAEAGKKESVPAADAKKEPTDDEGKKTDDDQELEFVEKDGKKYYRSFDKHPEWTEMRQAKATLDRILEDNEYASLDELTADLKTGLTLTELLGTADAKTVEGILKDAQDMQITREYWAEQEAKKKEEGETQEETIERLKREKQELLDTRKKETERQHELEGTKKALVQFSSEIERGVEQIDGLNDVTKGMLKMFLGVDNPMDDVDITDIKAVRGGMKESVTKFQSFVKAVEDAAIQRYVEGKEESPKIPPTGADDVVKTVVKKKPPENATMEELFEIANQELLESLEAMDKVPTE